VSVPGRGIDVSNTKNSLGKKSFSELLFNWCILKLCSYDVVVTYGPKLLEWSEKHNLSPVAYWFVKQTFFRQFCAGETLSESEQAAKRLYETHRVGSILDFSAGNQQQKKAKEKKEKEKKRISISLFFFFNLLFLCLYVCSFCF
jgi:proline dehydrogenase